MPSPAVTVNNIILAAASEREERSVSTGALLGSNTLNFSHLTGSATMLSKPATTVNPKRDDGTRKMSVYATSWCSMPSIPRRGGLRRNFGSVYYSYPDYPVVNVARAAPGPAYRLLSSIPATDKLASDAEARTRTLNKLSQKKWDLGVTALEMKQTVGLVTDLATGMVKTVDNIITAHRNSDAVLRRFFRDVIRQGDFYKAAQNVGLTDIRLLEDIRSRWMQYQFGVRPLVRDVYDASTALSDHLYKDGFAVLLRAKSGAERKSALRHVSVGTQDPYPRYTLIGETQVRDHYSVVYEMPLGNVGLITELGLDNPASLAWEVTRLSWMWDYGLAVGSWLSSMTATRHMIFREGCRSHLERLTTWEAVCTAVPPVTGTLRASYPSTMGTFSRTLIPSSGLTPAVMPVPRSDMGLIQLGNALFALSSVAQGKPGLR